MKQPQSVLDALADAETLRRFAVDAEFGRGYPALKRYGGIYTMDVDPFVPCDCSGCLTPGRATDLARAAFRAVPGLRCY